MIYAHNFKFYKNGKLIPYPEDQFKVATDDELEWLSDSIYIPFQIHRTDGTWGDEYGIIPSNTKPGHLPPYIIFLRPKGNIGLGDRMFSDKTCECRVKKAVYRYLGEKSEETLAIFAYL